MNSFAFANPYVLLLFIPLVYGFLKGLRQHRQGSLIFSSLQPLEKSLESLSLKRKNKKPFSPRKVLHLLRYLCLACVILGLARPQVIYKQGKQKTQGIDILLALDLSSSMLALDFSKGNQIMTRLEAVKAVLQEFIQKRPNDAIGLIAFAGNPYLVSPLTLNHDWLIQNLNRCTIGLIEDGTAIGSALVMAVNRLQAASQGLLSLTSSPPPTSSPSLATSASFSSSTSAPSRPSSPSLAKSTPPPSLIPSSSHPTGQVVILLTDGVNNKGEVSPELASELAAHHKIKVYTIGVGEGGIVPTLLLDDTGHVLKNAWGQLQVAQAQIPTDEATLKHIAEKTGGLFFQAKDKKQLASIYEVIDTIEKRELPLAMPEHIKDYFWIPLMLSLGLLVLELLLSHTRLQILP